MKRMWLLLVVLTVLVPATLWAQADGLTLDELAETVAGLTGRIEVLERLYSPAAITTRDGGCQLAIGETFASDMDGGLHPSTTAAYLALSGGLLPRQVQIESVSISFDGITTIEMTTWQDTSAGVFDYPYAYVVEYWDGCEFQSHSRFWKEGIMGSTEFFDE